MYLSLVSLSPIRYIYNDLVLLFIMHPIYGSFDFA